MRRSVGLLHYPSAPWIHCIDWHSLNQQPQYTHAVIVRDRVFRARSPLPPLPSFFLQSPSPLRPFSLFLCSTEWDAPRFPKGDARFHLFIRTEIAVRYNTLSANKSNRKEGAQSRGQRTVSKGQSDPAGDEKTND